MSEKGKLEGNKSKFSHFSKVSKVATSKKNKTWFGILLIAAVLVLIIFLMIPGSHKKQSQSKSDQGGLNSNASVFKENEQRLNKLRNESHEMPQIQQSGYDSPKDSKAYTARQNAPTQMYSARGAQRAPDSGVSTGVLSGSGPFSKFANSQKASPSSVTATKIKHPNYTIAEGDLIHGVLETAIDSDLPGMVRAVVTGPVYSYTGDKPLIPAGSRLIGQYESLSSNGSASSRVFVVWNRVITPSGISIMINSPGADSLGRGGMGADAVDTHFWKIFGTAALLSVMGASVSNTGVSSYQQPNSSDMYRQSIAGAFQQSAQSVLSQNMSIKPTIHVYQGDAINVFVAHDLDLYGVLANQS